MATVQSCNNYLIFFDDIRVDDLVKNWTVNLSCNGNIGTANIEFVYMEDIAKKAYDIKDIKRTKLILNMLGAIDSMTNVKIFVMNPFTKKFVMVFDGNITQKSRTKSSQGPNSLSFMASDHMNWLNRTIAPIVIPFTVNSHPSDKFVWEAMGIDTTKVVTLAQRDIVNFKGRTLEEIINMVVTQALAANKIYSDKGGVGYWDGAWERMDLMADIDKDILNKNVLDYIVDPDQTNTDTMYVLLNDIFSKLMFEFYQDRDGIIRIKPPFWSEPVLMSHVIDPMLIVSQSDSSNYSNFLTRVIITGGLDENYQSMGEIAKKLWTPIGCYMSDGAWSNAQEVQGFEMGYAVYGSGGSAEGTATTDGTFIPYTGNGNTQCTDSTWKSASTASKMDYICRCTQEEYAQHGILPSVNGAQALQESGLGTSNVAIHANNLFGMMYSEAWPGGYYQGSKNKYRKYKSIEECIHDRCVNFLGTDRYKSVKGITNFDDQIVELGACGYFVAGDNGGVNPATDTAHKGTYLTKHVRPIYNQYNLAQYDKDIIGKYTGPTYPSVLKSSKSSSINQVLTSNISAIRDFEFDYNTTVKNSGYPKKRKDGTLIVGEGNSKKLEKLVGYGIWFSDVETGIRAHIQHLSGLVRGKLLSSNECVDPSFMEDNMFINNVEYINKIKNRKDTYPKKIKQSLDDIYNFCNKETKDYSISYENTLTNYEKQLLSNYFSMLSLGKPIYISGNMTISQFVNIYIEEAEAEKISPYFALAQMIVDTGSLRWGESQIYQQNNFAKLGCGDSKEILMTASDWY